MQTTRLRYAYMYSEAKDISSGIPRTPLEKLSSIMNETGLKIKLAYRKEKVPKLEEGDGHG